MMIRRGGRTLAFFSFLAVLTGPGGAQGPDLDEYLGEYVTTAPISGQEQVAVVDTIGG